MNHENEAWTLLTNHAVVLFWIKQNPTATIAEIADAVGLSERHAARIIRDLKRAQLVFATRGGRHNTYSINKDSRLRHPLMQDVPVHSLLKMLTSFTAFTGCLTLQF
jgi:predicted transcriptional regulator